MTRFQPWPDLYHPRNSICKRGWIMTMSSVCYRCYSASLQRFYVVKDSNFVSKLLSSVNGSSSGFYFALHILRGVINVHSMHQHYSAQNDKLLSIKCSMTCVALYT